MGVICMNPFRLMRRIHADYSHAVMQSCHAHYQHPVKSQSLEKIETQFQGVYDGS